jgi:hypothetical protein
MTVSPRLRHLLLAGFALPFPACGAAVAAPGDPAPTEAAAKPAEIVPVKPKPAKPAAAKAAPAKPAPAKATAKPAAAKPTPAAPAASAAVAAAKPVSAKPAAKPAAKAPATGALVQGLGRPVTPLPALLATAKAVREAAAAKDAEAVFALVADEVTFASSGITLGVARTVRKDGPFPDAPTALEAIGLAFSEGEPVAPAGTPADPAARRIARAMAVMVATIGDPHWATDPMVPGAVCTAPGAKWDAAVAKRNGLAQVRGAFVLSDTVLRADRKASAKPVATLKPGTIVRADLGAGGDWEKVTLPPDKLAWAPPKTLHPATPWGFCFLPTAEGDWLLSAVVSASN